MSPKSLLAPLLFSLLAACGLDDRAEKPVGDDTDPALASALEDPILVDPALTQQSNSNALRPAATPLQAFYPAETEPAGAAEQARLGLMNGNGAGCGNGPFDHDLAWARRLPAAFALPPGARVTQAAGNDKPGCAIRVVTFASAESAERVLAFYRGRALGAGYSAVQQRRGGDHVLAGSAPGSGGHYYLIVTPKSSGSEVALIADRGI